jgi:hypothetical protein
VDEYEFNITVVGAGKCVDSAFQDALDKLSENPFDAIKGEVVYVNKATVEAEDEEIEAEDGLVN